jgi:light-regulated signal transduction histidine kinase (bacteriophytochrome)
MKNPVPANESLRLALSWQMEQLLAKLSHDLMGSLQLITGYANLLAEGTKGSLEPEQLEYLDFINVGTVGVRDAIERGQARLREIIQSEAS